MDEGPWLLCDTDGPRRAVNLTVNAKLLDQARELGIPLSAALEAHLQDLIRQRLRERWLDHNQEAFATYNAHVEQAGVFSDGLRRF